ncbi:MAG: redoxin domain-containing protein [Marinifilaceae bacterium]
MRNLFLAFLAVSLFFVSCDSGNKYTVSGKIAGVTEGKVYLNKLNGREFAKVDSADLVDGGFTFTGTVANPDVRYITIEGERASIMFFIENAKIQINADVAKMKEAEVTGSSSQNLYKSFEEMLEDGKVKEMELRARYKEAAQAKNQAAIDSVMTEYDALQTERNEKTKEFIKANNQSVVAAYIAWPLSYQLDVNDMENIYNSFGESVKQNSSFAAKIKAKIDVLKKVAIGQPAPEITLNTPEGEPFSLSSLKGKVVVIDFWASWCGPCRRENPHMVGIYKEMHDKGVEFLGVSLDKEKEAWLKAIEKDGLIWKHVSDLKYWDSAAAKLYGVNGIPHTVVVDKNGIIAAKKVFGKELKAEIEKLLN